MRDTIPRTRVMGRDRLHREIVRVELPDRDAPLLYRRGQGRQAYRFRPYFITIVYDYREGAWRASNTIIRGVRLSESGTPCDKRYVTQHFPFIRFSLAPAWVRQLVRKLCPDPPH